MLIKDYLYHKEEPLQSKLSQFPMPLPVFGSIAIAQQLCVLLYRVLLNTSVLLFFVLCVLSQPVYCLHCFPVYCLNCPTIDNEN